MPKKDVQPRTKNSDLFASNEVREVVFKQFEDVSRIRLNFQAESVGHVLLKPTLEFPTKEVFPMVATLVWLVRV